MLDGWAIGWLGWLGCWMVRYMYEVSGVEKMNELLSWVSVNYFFIFFRRHYLTQTFLVWWKWRSQDLRRCLWPGVSGLLFLKSHSHFARGRWCRFPSSEKQLDKLSTNSRFIRNLSHFVGMKRNVDIYQVIICSWPFRSESGNRFSSVLGAYW